jgi:nucleoside phosphorylase
MMNKASLTLFIFAHRGEAREFLLDFRPLHSESKNPIERQLWKHQTVANTFALICGEGVFDSMQWTTAALTYLSPNFNISVINVGLAGSLTARYQVGEWVEIKRVCYCQEDLNWQFSTFTSHCKTNSANAVSFSKRVFDPKMKHFLSTQGDVVDRELWGIAKACELFDVPWFSKKLISDNWDDDNQAICKTIRSEWKKWSELIQAHCESQFGQAFPLIADCLGPDFYFSHSMLHQLIKLRATMDTIKSISYEIPKELTPKDRGRELLKRLAQLTWPQLSAFQTKTAEWLKSQEHKGLKIHGDPQLETSNLKIELQASNQAELNHHIETLQKFSFSDYESFLDGNPLP